MQPFTIKAVETVKGIENVIFVWSSNKQFKNSEWNVSKVTDYLDVVDGLTVLVKKLPIIIGRVDFKKSQSQQPSNLIINGLHNTVSRRHAQISEHKGVIKVRDLKSTYGTFILQPNKTPLRVTETAVELKNKDVILLGSTVQLSVIFEGTGIVKRFWNWLFG